MKKSMKYKIDIMDKQQCTVFSTNDLNEDCIIISINDTDCNTVIFDNKHILDVLKVVFDDLEKEPKNKENKYKLFDIHIAKEIKNFIDKYKDGVKYIVCHCTAGISRSASVGAVVSRYLNGTDNYIFSSGEYYPNRLVYKTMCEAFRLEYDEVEFTNKRDRSERNCINNTKGCMYGMTLEDMFSEEYCDVIID